MGVRSGGVVVATHMELELGSEAEWGSVDILLLGWVRVFGGEVLMVAVRILQDTEFMMQVHAGASVKERHK